MQFTKIGVAGPVGSGKTALVEALTRRLAGKYSMGVITNDIYTKEDAEFLTAHSVLPPERIMSPLKNLILFFSKDKNQIEKFPLSDFFSDYNLL